MIYFLYKEYLKRTNEELFSERFETWKYGPVLPSVYFEFSSFGKETITRFARDSQNNVMLVEESGIFKEVLDTVWSKYKDFSGQTLSEMTHKPDSAWTKACNKRSYFLTIEDIKNEPEL